MEENKCGTDKNMRIILGNIFGVCYSMTFSVCPKHRYHIIYRLIWRYKTTIHKGLRDKEVVRQKS